MQQRVDQGSHYRLSRRTAYSASQASAAARCLVFSQVMEMPCALASATCAGLAAAAARCLVRGLI